MCHAEKCFMASFLQQFWFFFFLCLICSTFPVSRKMCAAFFNPMRNCLNENGRNFCCFRSYFSFSLFSRNSLWARSRAFHCHWNVCRQFANFRLLFKHYTILNFHIRVIWMNVDFFQYCKFSNIAIGLFLFNNSNAPHPNIQIRWIISDSFTSKTPINEL